MAHVWRGIINEYLDRLPFDAEDRIVTLGEGGTPLIPVPSISKEVGAEVFVKY